MQIVIRLAGGQDISFETPTPQSTTLKQLRELVREKRGGTTVNRQLRFFVNGHSLVPREDFAPRERERETETGEPGDPAGHPDRVYIHCFLGRILSPEELAREANQELQQPAPQPLNAQEPHGFERLRGMGFSEQEVQDLRQQFADIHGMTDGDEQQAIEDAWIDNGDMSRYSSRIIDMLCILIGVFAGAWALLLYKFHLFPRRQYMTIMFGVVFNMMFSLLQYLA